MSVFGNLRQELERVVSENIFETEHLSSRTSVSIDSGLISESSSSEMGNNVSNNSEVPRPANNDPPQSKGGIGWLGIAGIAIGAYTVGKLLFGSKDPPPSSSRRRFYEDEEEVRVRRAPKHPQDFFNPSYISRISKQIKK